MDLNFIRAVRGDGSLDSVFLLITNLGSELGYIALLTLTFMLIPRVGRQLGLWFGVGVAINTAFKYGFNLPRPFTLEPDLASAAAKATAGGPGLPSGHAQNAAFFWGVLGLYLSRPVIWVFCVTVIALVAFSRLYLGVHFLDDVLLGLLLGAGMAFVATRVAVGHFNAIVAFGLLLALGALSALLPEDYGRTFGVLWGFSSASATFSPPARPLPRVAFALGGLLLALALYLGSSVLLPEFVKRSGVGNFLRYALLTFAVAEIYPRLVLGSPVKARAVKLNAPLM
jgi:hypothetical protein